MWQLDAVPSDFQPGARIFSERWHEGHGRDCYESRESDARPSSTTSHGAGDEVPIALSGAFGVLVARRSRLGSVALNELERCTATSRGRKIQEQDNTGGARNQPLKRMSFFPVFCREAETDAERDSQRGPRCVQAYMLHSNKVGEEPLSGRPTPSGCVRNIGIPERMLAFEAFLWLSEGLGQALPTAAHSRDGSYQPPAGAFRRSFRRASDSKCASKGFEVMALVVFDV